MSEEYNPDFIAGYGDGVLRLHEKKNTPDYIAGYEMGRRLRKRKEHPQQQQSMQAPFEIPGTHRDYINEFRVGKSDAQSKRLRETPPGDPQYDSGYEMGFVTVPQPSLYEDMAHASNRDVGEVFASFENDELLNKRTPKRTKRDGGKSKRSGGKSKRRGGKTKKRNQKK